MNYELSISVPYKLHIAKTILYLIGRCVAYHIIAPLIDNSCITTNFSRRAALSLTK